MKLYIDCDYLENRTYDECDYCYRYDICKAAYDAEYEESKEEKYVRK